MLTSHVEKAHTHTTKSKPPTILPAVGNFVGGFLTSDVGHMHTLWIILACFAGVFAFAFLLAGMLGLQDTTPPKDRGDAAFRFVDATLFGGIGSIIRGFDKNWATSKEERRLFCAGVGCLGFFILFACLAVFTK